MPANSTHDQYNHHSPDWTLIRDFAGGERAVKAKGERYLPKLSDQDHAEYRNYLFRSPFLNATARTVAGLVGVVFRRPPKVDLGSNERLRPFLESITQDDAPFDALARNVVAEVIQMGRYGLLVDMPQAGGRPYVAEYKAEQISNWRERHINGRRRVSQVVLTEHDEQDADDGFGSVYSDRWRELRLTTTGYQQVLHQPVSDQRTRATSWLASNPITPVNRGEALADIPFVFIGPAGLTAAVQRSPVLDIVNLSQHHYLAAADLAHGRHYAAMPTPWVSGFNGGEDAEFTIGPNRVWMIPADGSAGLLEFNGAGLTFLENATSDYQVQMAMLGARLLSNQRKAASESSDIVQLRERGEHATLWGIVDSCERALTRVLQHWVAWQDGDPSEVKVHLNKDFVDMPMAYRDTLMLMRLYQSGILPLDATIEALYEGDILPSTMKPEDVKELLAQGGQMYSPAASNSVH